MAEGECTASPDAHSRAPPLLVPPRRCCVWQNLRLQRVNSYCSQLFGKGRIVPQAALCQFVKEHSGVS